MTLSQYPFCQGEARAVTTGLRPRLSALVLKLVSPIDPITIPDQESDVRIPRRRLCESLSRPLSGRVRGDSELKDSAPREIQNHEDE